MFQFTKASLGNALWVLAAVLFSFSALPAQTPGEPLQIYDVKLSNLVGTAFVVSWRTSLPATSNQLLYGLDPTNLSNTVNDSLKTASTLHFTQVIFLDVGKTYYYRVRSDGLEQAGIDSVRTFQQALPGIALILQGIVTDQTGRPVPKVIVRSYYKWIKQTGQGPAPDSTMWWAVLTSSDGRFNMDLANYRTYAGTTANYNAGQTWLYLNIFGQAQGALTDSVLLSADPGVGNFQTLPTYILIDERKKAVHGLIEASSPVLANGISASLVRMTILDDRNRPIPNVELALRASPERGVTYLQPQSPTDINGRIWGLVYSNVAEDKTIRVINLTADSTELDTFLQVTFVDPPGDLRQDKTPPFIYFTTQYPNTKDNIGPYRIISRVVDNFTVNVKLLWTTRGNIYNDTIPMAYQTAAQEYSGDIPGQAYNSVVNYFVFAQDSAGFKVSKPDSLVSDPFILPYRFEVISPVVGTVPKMGITLTTDAMDVVNHTLPVFIQTRVTSGVRIRTASIKWRNQTLGLYFNDITMQHFGARYWGFIPAQPTGSRIDYFIQVTDSLGRVEKDPRLAPDNDLFGYQVLDPTAFGPVSFVDTTNYLMSGALNLPTRGVAAGDLNGDGYLDLVAANYGRSNSVFYYNTNTGTFRDMTGETMGAQSPDKSTYVVLADVNADDYLDIIYANEGEQSRLYLNNGLGRFDDVTLKIFGPSGSTHFPRETWDTQCVLAEDFNGDGSIDLYFVNGGLGGQKNRLLFNDSLGVFRDVSDNYLNNHPADQSIWAIAGDLNLDGYTDIAVLNRAQNHAWLRNNGSGFFQYFTIAAVSAGQARGGELLDVDGDGDLDLVVAQSETQQNELFINTLKSGRVDFVKDTSGRLPPESDNTYAIKVLDVNADGYPDLYYLNYGQLNRLLLNDGRGYFRDAPTGLMPTWESLSRGAVVGDFNRDKRMDLFVAEEDRRNTLLFSRSSGSGGGNSPSGFDLIFPAQGDTLSADSTTFSWERSIPADSTDKVRYTFVLSLDSLFSAGKSVAQFDTTANSIKVANLTDNSRYWWKVTARSGSGLPVESNQVNNFLVLVGFQGTPPEFVVLLNRNPVFTGFFNIYVVASEPLAASPTVTVNSLEQLPVARIGQNDIWRAHYYTRSSFLLNVTGTNRSGRTGEFSHAYASVLASAGARSSVPSPDGLAWLILDLSGESESVQVLIQQHEPLLSEKMKARLVSLEGLGLDPEGGLEAILAGDCYTFTALSGSLPREVEVAFRGGRQDAAALVVCRLERGSWQPVETVFDPARGIYSARTGQLGTFALREAAAGAARLPQAGSFALGQNTPNPFNPTTFISYSVPGPAPVKNLTLKIYNLRGMSVRNLVSGTRQPGTYTVQWDGRTDEGREVPSGVYFYRLSAPGINLTRKMVLLR